MEGKTTNRPPLAPLLKGRNWGWLFLILSLLPVVVRAEAERSEVPLADPYILLEDGVYYAYGTHSADGIECYTSQDLYTWKLEGLALDKRNTTEDHWFWAPEVYHIGNRYIMYYSANEHLYAATSDSPKGPFRQVGSYQMESLLGDEKCIDSHVFFDKDGTAWLFFVRFSDGNAIWQCQLGEDYITPVEGTLRLCFSASQPWELIQARVNEGPNIIKHKKRYYLTYSGNDYQSKEYAVGYATSRKAEGPWKKYADNPILLRREGLVGTGHHSIFTDKEGRQRIVFHAHYSNAKIHPRLMYIGFLRFNGSRLEIGDEPVVSPLLAK